MAKIETVCYTVAKIRNGYRISTKHLRYRDVMVVDVIPSELGKAMENIATTMNNQHKVACLFEVES